MLQTVPQFHRHLPRYAPDQPTHDPTSSLKLMIRTHELSVIHLDHFGLCYELNERCPPNSYAGALPPKVMVFEDGTFVK